MQAETYLEFIDHTNISRPYQMMLLISVIYKSAIELESTLMEHGHKMNLAALEAFRAEIGSLHFDMETMKACIEN